MDYLRWVVEALRGQTLEQSAWELIVVDNNSKPALQVASSQTSVGSEDQRLVELGWHPNARVVREDKLGLTFARLRGFAEANGDLIVLVDDDNVLAPDYLENAVSIAQRNPALGAFGGKCAPEFEVEPPKWLEARGKGLGLRDRGEVPQLFPEETGGGPRDVRTTGQRGEETRDQRTEIGSRNEKGRQPNTANRQRRAVREFPDCAPIGAGMVLRRDAARAYAERLQARGARQEAIGAETITDRKGDSLASGGDNDICLTAVEEGWQVGYLPQLQLTHLIPKGRMTLDYQRRMARDAVRSYLLMLDQHGIRPHAKIPRWSVPLRIAKDFLRVRPWRTPEASLEWHSHIGQYLARAELARAARA